MRLPDVSATLDFAEKLRLRRRLDELKAAHSTGLVLSEAQTGPILDIAAQAGLAAMVELGIDPGDLSDRPRWRGVISRVAHVSNVYRGHGALFGYLIDCPVSQDALRACGLERVRRRLGEVARTIKRRDPDALVAIKVRPETRGLAMLDEDLIYSEIPALEPVELRDFVVSLHNIAEARPVVIEFAEASPGQDEAVAVAFGTGAAGVVAPPVPAPASHNWLGIRMLRAAELMPFMTLNGSCPPGPQETPMVSVVICAYDAERTMRQCLESLTKLTYPNCEVIIVDDGSRDRTAEIAMDYPQFRLIRQPNKGLSAARNVGLHAARGDIIAYTDSDCVVDPHWLTLMIRGMTEGRFDACGGPNYAPHEEGRIEGSVAASPGAPCHVLAGETVAEHIAGCNMVFSKSALLKVGGFDPQFTSAGDDVDICWRMLDAGLKIGYCPSAFVWHFRRNTIRAYYGQQRGYGRAEAMLYARYPERFNCLGQIKWRGTIPGLARTLPGGSRRRVFWRAPRAGAQNVFDPAIRLAAFLPQTFEWSAFWALAIVASAVAGVTVAPALAMLSLGPLWALYYAWHAPVEKCHRGIASRLLIAFLAYTGPIRRAVARYKMVLAMQRPLDASRMLRQRPSIDWSARAIRLAYWNEEYVTRETLLDRMLKLFARSRHPAIIDPGWNDFDIEVRPDPWTRVELKTADEEHEGGKLKNHVIARVRLSRVSCLGLAAGFCGAGAAAILGMPTVAAGLAAVSMAAAASALVQLIGAGRAAYRAIEECAGELNLIPLGQLVGRRAVEPLPVAIPAPAVAKPARSVELVQANQSAAD